MPFYITKADGKQELFDSAKFSRSLKRAGASTQDIKELLHDIEEQTELRTTRDLYRYALQKLKHISPTVATRYSLKQALIALGPAGFPFEKYAARLFEQMGFTTTLNQIMKGFCIEHEIDFVAEQGERVLLVECKFHSLQKLKSDLKVALYVHARLQDIEKLWSDTPYHAQEQREAWIVTNTKFTTEAQRYAQCAGIKLLGWNYPAHKPLPELIHELKLHPITALTTLKSREQRELIKQKIILCSDLIKNAHNIDRLGIPPIHAQLALQEAQALCL